MTFVGEPYDETYFEQKANPAALKRRDGYTSYAGLDSAHAERIADDIEAATGPVSGKRVLEMGCGYGLLAVKLADRGANIDGVDISPFALKEARQRNPSVNYVRYLEADVTGELFYAENTFALVVADGVADCMPDETSLNLMLAEMDRLLHTVGMGYILGSDESKQGYLTKSFAQWEIKTLGGRQIRAENVRHLPWQVRALVVAVGV